MLRGDWHEFKRLKDTLLIFVQDNLIKIDIEDLDKVDKYRWKINPQGYCSNTTLGQMHKIVMPKKEGFEIDHIDRDKLNNKKSNLRYVTKTENGINRSSRNKYSNFKGISWNKLKQRYEAKMNYEGKRVSLGYYKTIQEAEASREGAERLLFARVLEMKR